MLQRIMNTSQMEIDMTKPETYEAYAYETGFAHGQDTRTEWPVLGQCDYFYMLGFRAARS